MRARRRRSTSFTTISMYRACRRRCVSSCAHAWYANRTRWSSSTRRASTAARNPFDGVWADITVDFIEGLPKVNGKSVILTVVYCFSKYAHFFPWGTPTQ
jgi:hypothetical protein